MKNMKNKTKDPDVKFIHYRFVDGENKDINGNETVSCRGGATVAYKRVEGGDFIVAKALCHTRDNFNRHTGRAKAGGRLKSPRYAASFKDFPSEDDLIERLDSEFASYQYVRQERKSREKKALTND
jgi:hypothetical protein